MHAPPSTALWPNTSDWLLRCCCVNCVIAVCSDSPPDPDNGRFACGSSTLPGNSCSAICRPGYSGSPTAVCSSAGDWGSVNDICTLIGELVMCFNSQKSRCGSTNALSNVSDPHTKRLHGCLSLPLQCALATLLTPATAALTVVGAPCLAIHVRRSVTRLTAENRLPSARRTALGVRQRARAS
jgi:hypothetical protein